MMVHPLTPKHDCLVLPAMLHIHIHVRNPLMSFLLSSFPASHMPRSAPGAHTLGTLNTHLFYLQVHWPEGQAHDVPHEQEQPGAVGWETRVSLGYRDRIQRDKKVGVSIPILMVYGKDVRGLCGMLVISRRLGVFGRMEGGEVLVSDGSV